MVCEVVETLSRRKVDLCCVQETTYRVVIAVLLRAKTQCTNCSETIYRGGHCCIIKGKDSMYKLFWSGNSKGTAGVGVFVGEKWIEKVLRSSEFPTRTSWCRS